ncbi:PHD finger protein 12 isoform X2 [Toxotes jaculatrix]|nr:PHD finger protein 12 isoform X2 [Toxotes jaculatrix]
MLPPGEWMCHRCNVRKKKREQKSEQTNGLPERSSSKRSASPAVELELNAGPLRLDGLPPGAGAAGPGLRVAQVRLLDRRTSSRPSSRPGTPTSNTSSTPTPSEEQNDGEEEAAEPEDEVQGAELDGATPTAPTPRLLKRPFQLLIAAAMERNPTQFQLPSELTCTTALPGSSKRRRKEELLGKPFKRPQHELDPNGLVPLPVKVCFSCNRSCRLAPLIQCDYCPLLFHMDCLDPPLTALPAGKWMCPNHVEHLVLNQKSLSLSSRCQLFDQFQDRMSQHAVKLDFLRRAHRQNAPNRRTTFQHNKKAIKVPDAIKSQYQNPPPMLLPAGVHQLELVCSGVPDHQPSKHLTSEADQQEWLQDVIALQCSIMRHLSIKQKGSSTASTLSSVTSSAESPSEQKASAKSCVTSEDMKTQASLGRTSSPDLCSKPCSTPDDPQGASLSRDTPAELGVCKCSVTPCQNCRKPNGPLAEECQPPKANGPVDCNSSSDSCRQVELLHRVKPSTTPPDSAPTSGLVNHIGAETVKKEPESTTEACAQKNCPTALTIWPHSGQQNHRNQTVLQEECMTSSEKPSYSITSSAQSESDTPPKGNQEQNSTKLGSSSPTPDIKAGPELMDSVLSSTHPSIANLSSCIKDGKDADGGIELDKLDAEMIKLLAWQRIQQLFPTKGPSTLLPPVASDAPKSPSPHPDSKKKVQARAVFYPLTGKGGAVSMCYRTLYIGSGADMDVCLTNYGHCNYISGKHACIFYDENTKHYELLNYSEHGTTVDNVLYSCDFSEKASPSLPSGLVAKVQGIIRRSKKREEGEGPSSVVGLLPAGGVMSSHPQGSPELSCSCKASSSSLIGGSGAGWEGTALLHHGSYIKLGCLQFVFSITEFASKQPKEEQTSATSAGSCASTTTATTTSSGSNACSTSTNTAPNSTSTPPLPPLPNTATVSSPSSQDEADTETVPPHQVPVLHSNSVP